MELINQIFPIIFPVGKFLYLWALFMLADTIDISMQVLLSWRYKVKLDNVSIGVGKTSWQRELLNAKIMVKAISNRK